jgi:hypothetical protein
VYVHLLDEQVFYFLFYLPGVDKKIEKRKFINENDCHICIFYNGACVQNYFELNIDRVRISVKKRFASIEVRENPIEQKSIQSISFVVYLKNKSLFIKKNTRLKM